MTDNAPDEQPGSDRKWWLTEGSDICSVCEAAVHPETLEFCVVCDQGVCAVCLPGVESTSSGACPTCLNEYSREADPEEG